MGLKLVTIPNEILKKQSTDVENVDNSIKKLVDEMFSIMYNSEGIGLAAVQVGVLKNIIVIDISPCYPTDSENYDDVTKTCVFINPRFHSYSKETVPMREGCLSVPDNRISVVRSKSVSVDYLDIHGKQCSMNLDAMLARVALHEYDHLLGRLIIDYLPYMEKESILASANNPL